MKKTSTLIIDWCQSADKFRSCAVVEENDNFFSFFAHITTPKIFKTFSTEIFSRETLIKIESFRCHSRGGKTKKISFYLHY